REVVDGVDRTRHVHEVADVGAQQPKPRLGHQVRDVVALPGDEVVEADDVPAVAQQPLADVRAEEARSARDDRAAGGHQPNPRTTKPASRAAAVSTTPRPSRINLPFIRSASRPKSSAVNSDHSVATTTAS